jgi:hypothetical protein
MLNIMRLNVAERHRGKRNRCRCGQVRQRPLAVFIIAQTVHGSRSTDASSQLLVPQGRLNAVDAQADPLLAVLAHLRDHQVDQARPVQRPLCLKLAGVLVCSPLQPESEVQRRLKLYDVGNALAEVIR